MFFIKILHEGVHHPHFQSRNFSSSIEAHKILIALGYKFTTMRISPCYWLDSVSALSVSLCDLLFPCTLTVSVWIVNWKLWSHIIEITLFCCILRAETGLFICDSVKFGVVSGQKSDQSPPGWVLLTGELQILSSLRVGIFHP